MFRPHYQIYTQGSIGTQFEKKDVLDPVKSFLDRNGIPSEIVEDVNIFYNDIRDFYIWQIVGVRRHFLEKKYFQPG